MAFDPTKPANGTALQASELRNQFTGLKDLIDAGSSQYAPLVEGWIPLALIPPGGCTATGASSAPFNGFYVYAGEYRGRPYFTRPNAIFSSGTGYLTWQFWNGQDRYLIAGDLVNTYGPAYYSDGELADPWHDEPSVNVGPNAPTFTVPVIFDTPAARDAAIAGALNGLTQDVILAGVTLHFTNGLLTAVS